MSLRLLLGQLKAKPTNKFVHILKEFEEFVKLNYSYFKNQFNSSGVVSRGGGRGLLKAFCIKTFYSKPNGTKS